MLWQLYTIDIYTSRFWFTKHKDTNISLFVKLNKSLQSVFRKTIYLYTQTHTQLHIKYTYNIYIYVYVCVCMYEGLFWSLVYFVIGSEITWTKKFKKKTCQFFDHVTTWSYMFRNFFSYFTVSLSLQIWTPNCVFW